MIKYVIPGHPQTWARAGHNKKNNRFYDTQKHIKQSMAIFIENCHGSRAMYQGPLHLDILFYFPWKGNPDKMPHWFDKTPDLDNCDKLIMDVCSKRIFPDDRQVCKKTSSKLYSLEPRTEFTIVELK